MSVESLELDALEWRRRNRKPSRTLEGSPSHVAAAIVGLSFVGPSWIVSERPTCSTRSEVATVYSTSYSAVPASFTQIMSTFTWLEE